MTIHRKILGAVFALLLCASAMAGTNPPPAGVRVTNRVLANYVTLDTLRLTLNGATFTLYALATNDHLDLTTGQDTLHIMKPLLVTGNSRVTGNLDVSGALTAASATIPALLGSTNMQTGNLTGASNSSFGVSGFTFPYQASTSPTGEGIAMWNSYYNRLYIGAGSTDPQPTRIFYSVIGTPLMNYVPVYDTNTNSALDNYLEWKSFALASLLDVVMDSTPRDGQVFKWDTTGIGAGGTGKWRLNTDDTSATGTGTVDSFFIVLNDSGLNTSGWVHGTDTTWVDTTGGTGGADLWEAGLTDDTVSYSGTSQELFSLFEQADSTVITPGVNTFLKLPSVIADGIVLNGYVTSNHFIGKNDEVTSYAGYAGRDVYVGGYGAATTNLMLNQAAVAGSRVNVYDNTTNTWYFDHDSLSGINNSTSKLINCKYLGDTINLAYIAQTGATTGQVPKWSGTAWVAGTILPGGLWQYTGSHSQWFAYHGDSLAITFDTLNDTAYIDANVPLSISGGTGTPHINFGGTDHLDSAQFHALHALRHANGIVDSQLPVAVHNLFHLNGIVDSQLPSAVHNIFHVGGVVDSMIPNNLSLDTVTGDLAIKTTPSGRLFRFVDSAFVIGTDTICFWNGSQIVFGNAGITTADSLRVTGRLDFADNSVADTTIPDSIAITLGDSSVVEAKIRHQTIIKDDIDSTASNVVFDDAYRGTSATTDSLYGTEYYARHVAGDSANHMASHIRDTANLVVSTRIPWYCTASDIVWNYPTGTSRSNDTTTHATFPYAPVGGYDTTYLVKVSTSVGNDTTMGLIIPFFIEDSVTVDSFIVYAATSSATADSSKIDSVLITYTPTDSATINVIGGVGTDRVGTAMTRYAYACSRSATPGEIIRARFRLCLKQDEAAVMILKAQLKGNRR
jgi:hypothetical protein